MPFKYDDSGSIVLQEVNGAKLPVFVYGDGREAPFDGDHTIKKIGELNGEAKTHREAKEAAEKMLKSFEGIDPAAATKALQTLKNLDDKKLVDAGEVEKVKREAVAAYEERIQAMTSTHANEMKKREEALSAAQSALHNELIGGFFSRSKYIAEKFAIPADLVQARFGSNFRVEEGGKIVAYDSSGNKLYSRNKPGELADPEEALSLLVDAYPYKDNILKGTGASGGGAPPNGGAGAGGGGKTMPRSQFERLDPAAKQQAMSDRVRLVDA